jgi:hypothetical protein
MLRSMAVDVFAQTITTSVEITQIYQNNSSASLEALFSLGLGENMCVSKFEIQHNDQDWQAAALLKTAVALDKYDDALSAGSTGVVATRGVGGTFSLTVGNFAPNAKIAVRVTVCALLLGHQVRGFCKRVFVFIRVLKKE